MDFSICTYCCAVILIRVPIALRHFVVWINLQLRHKKVFVTYDNVKPYKATDNSVVLIK